MQGFRFKAVPAEDGEEQQHGGGVVLVVKFHRHLNAIVPYILRAEKRPGGAMMNQGSIVIALDGNRVMPIHKRSGTEYI